MNEISIPKEAPLITTLKETVDEGRRLVQSPNVTGASLEMWVIKYRVPITKIYGSDSAAAKFFPTPGADDRSLPVQVRIQHRLTKLEHLLASLEKAPLQSSTPSRSNRIFIGHGRSPIWRELKDFLVDRLGLQHDEFNRESIAGISTSDRLATMVSEACFAFLVMTAEDEHANQKFHARQNVIHEAGLFQGSLGFKRAIVLLEEGCEEFSNIFGMSQIRFPPNRISAVFEDVRSVLIREDIL